MSKDLKRRDKLFIAVFALSAILLYAAGTENYEIKDLAWDFGLILIFFGGIFWLIMELGDQFTVVLNFGVPQQTRVARSRSRTEMVDMAGELTGVRKDVLHQMTDIELNGIIDGSGSSSAGTMAPLHVIVFGVLRLMIKTVKWIVMLPKNIVRAPGKIKSGIAEVFGKLEGEWTQEAKKL
jgi:hypothetical protein